MSLESASTPGSIALTAAAVLLVSLVLLGCASAGPRATSTSYEQREITPVGRHSPSDRVANEDLATVTGANLEDALRRLRADWFRVSPTGRQAAEPGLASVYVNDAYAGGLDALRLIPIDAVTDARYLTPSAARSWFGMFCRCAGGVILVSTRKDE